MYNLIIVPSLFCPASCKYCFGPNQGIGNIPHRVSSSGRGNSSCWSESKIMDLITIEYALDFALRLIDEPYLSEKEDIRSYIRVIFHGGEPLSAGITFFKEALPQIVKRFQASIVNKVKKENLLSKETHLKVNATHPVVEFSLQSNLWMLTEDMCRLFAEYGVGLGVSLDGPEEITDIQRGSGYFQKTMDALDMARRHDLSTTCLVTFTRYSTAHVDEVYDFFVREGLDFNFHQAVPSLNGEKEDLWSLYPEEYGELLVNLFEKYLKQPPGIKIDTIDSLCQNVTSGKGCICTFTDCLGDFFAIAPDGGIYPCQRFIDKEAAPLKKNSIFSNGFCLGNVRDYPDIHDLRLHPFWQHLKKRQDAISKIVSGHSSDCSSCTYLSFCRGGCVYNTLSFRDESLKDPYCPAYKRIYRHIIDRAISDIFSEENLSIAVEEGGGLIKKGRLLELMKR